MAPEALRYDPDPCSIARTLDLIGEKWSLLVLREVFDLVRIQGLPQTEAAEVLGVSLATVKRRLNRGLLSLTEALRDLRPDPSVSGTN